MWAIYHPKRTDIFLLAIEPSPNLKPVDGVTLGSIWPSLAHPFFFPCQICWYYHGKGWLWAVTHGRYGVRMWLDRGRTVAHGGIDGVRRVLVMNGEVGA